MSSGGHQDSRHQASRLRRAALRLAAELDQARYYTAAAHAAMVADAILQAAEVMPFQEPLSTRFDVDEHGRVWMVRDGDHHILGGRMAVVAEMRRFLSQAVPEEARGDA